MSPLGTHVIVLPGGGYAQRVAHEGEPIVRWLNGLGVEAGVFRYPLMVRHPEPLLALRAEIRRLRDGGAERIGLIGFSAGGHLGGLAALAPGAQAGEAVDFAVLGYAITSMQTETYRPARSILLGDDATPQLRRATSLDALVTASAPPFFAWHTAEDAYVPPEHTYRLAASLAAHGVPHCVHVFAPGPHSLGLAEGSGDDVVARFDGLHRRVSMRRPGRLWAGQPPNAKEPRGQGPRGSSQPAPCPFSRREQLPRPTRARG